MYRMPHPIIYIPVTSFLPLRLKLEVPSPRGWKSRPRLPMNLCRSLSKVLELGEGRGEGTRNSVHTCNRRREMHHIHTYIGGNEMELTFRYLTHNVNGTRPCINTTMYECVWVNVCVVHPDSPLTSSNEAGGRSVRNREVCKYTS